MNTRSIFREFKLPVARKNGRLPVFLDFTLGGFNQENLLPQFIDELVSKCANFIDGVILSPILLPGIAPVNDKIIWIRTGDPSAFLLQKNGNENNRSTSLNLQELVQHGISGILGTLMLGSSASQEADNIQHLSLLRSRTLDVGLPFAIDIHMTKELSEDKTCSEIIEFGLNLAVELGGDFAILPMADYLPGNVNIEKIAVVPILVRQTLQDVLSKDHPAENQKFISEKSGGSVLTDLQARTLLFEDYQLLEMWSSSMQFTPVGGR